MPKKNLLIITIVIIVGLLAVLIWNKTATEDIATAPPPPPETTIETVTEPDPEPVSIEPEIVEPPAPEIIVVAPPVSVDNSDSQVHLALADFAPKLSTWLLPDEQIRKWVLTIDLMADGKLPKRYRPVDYPMPQFATAKENSDTVLSENNYARMNEIINTITAIDPELLARYYQEWLPTLEQAFREQGKSSTFDQRFKQTMSQVLAANNLQEEPTLIRPKVLYQYEDKRLEAASDIDKLLWRMGPENSEKLQAFLREFRAQLDQ